MQSMVPATDFEKLVGRRGGKGGEREQGKVQAVSM